MWGVLFWRGLIEAKSTVYVLYDKWEVCDTIHILLPESILTHTHPSKEKNKAKRARTEMGCGRTSGFPCRGATSGVILLVASANRDVAAVVAVGVGVDSSAMAALLLLLEAVVVVAPVSMVLSVVAAKSSMVASLTETAPGGAPWRFFLAEFWKACFCFGVRVGCWADRFHIRCLLCIALLCIVCVACLLQVGPLAREAPLAVRREGGAGRDGGEAGRGRGGLLGVEEHRLAQGGGSAQAGAAAAGGEHGGVACAGAGGVFECIGGE